MPIYFWAIGAGAVGAGVLALLVYLRKDRPGKLVYQWNGRIIVGKEKEELPEEITNAMREAGSPYISTSEIVLWNAGHRTIRRSEINHAEPLRVTMAPGAKILRSLVLCQTNDAISFEVKQDRDPERPNVALCSFDFLAPGEGVRLQFLETGVNYRFNLKGAVRGLPSEILDWGRGPIGDPSIIPKSRLTRWSPYVLLALYMAAVPLIPIALLIKVARYGHDPDFQLLSSGDWLRMLNFTLFFWFVARSTIAQHRMRYGRYPKGLADH